MDGVYVNTADCTLLAGDRRFPLHFALLVFPEFPHISPAGASFRGRVCVPGGVRVLYTPRAERRAGVEDA